jgi:DNA-binding response OmpR family regulator
MDLHRTILIVDPDSGYGRSLAVVLKRQGNRVRFVRTCQQALLATKRDQYDLAIVDLFLAGGGVELARKLSPHVAQLVLTLGVRMEQNDILQAALGFQVYCKSALAKMIQDDAHPALMERRNAPGRAAKIRH